jgi:hypothetical protein
VITAVKPTCPSGYTKKWVLSEHDKPTSFY